MKTFQEWLKGVNISPGHIKETLGEIAFLSGQICPNLPINAGPDLDGFLIYWRHDEPGKPYLEITVKPNGRFDWFYSNGDFYDGNQDISDWLPILEKYLPMV